MKAGLRHFVDDPGLEDGAAEGMLPEMRVPGAGAN